MLNIQLEKATPARRSKNKGLLHRLQARTYHLPAHVTSEEDWQRDVPNIKLSRAFAVVLGIHVVAIGGFMAFELFRHKDSAGPDGQPGRAPSAARSEARETAASPAFARIAPASTRAAEPNLDDPANEGLKTYVVGPGETLAAIAGKLNVDERLLAEKNNLGDQRPFESGMKLVIPNHQMVAKKPEDVEKLLANRLKVPDAPLENLVEDKPLTLPESAPAKPAARAPAESNPVSPKAVKKEVAAKEAYKPTRRAEPVGETVQVRPNKDPRRLAAPPATLAAAQASRLSTASGSSPRIAEKKLPARVPIEKSSSSKGPAAKSGGRTHVVAEGETAYRIARTYKVDVAALIKVNGIKPETLRPGTQLVIPTSVR